jgi:hypothetical protein
MIGMDFVSFLTLLIISVVVSGILHYGLNYYVTPGHWSFCSKIVVGWIGAWLLYLDIGGQAFVTAKSTSCPPSSGFDRSARFSSGYWQDASWFDITIRMPIALSIS